MSPETPLFDLTESRLSDPDLRARIQSRAKHLVQHLRDDAKPGLMELMLSEYGLSTDEGVALMCLAEALLRVPDHETMDDLIEDKIVPSEWGKHLGQSSSSLINSATWSLMMTGRVLDETTPISRTIGRMVKRLGEPVIRRAVREAMKVMGRQFVLGETIEEAIRRSRGQFRYSYDMLGEAAMTAADAAEYLSDYEGAIEALAARCNSDDIADNPGISVKLSALHPRYDEFQRGRVMAELLPRLRHLCLMAKAARMGLNIDAEESERLDLNLDLFDALLRDEALAGWDGLGLVVQAYGRRAAEALDRVDAITKETGRRVMVRLVKGAYWDTEIKRAQVMGLPGYPVWETKAQTDRNYILCAERLLSMTDRVYPQFATHNAHSVAAILEMAEPGAAYEFQRLHGMGEALHDHVRAALDRPVRIYAPVGEHRDLLAYLVRRLLENGANSSFVSKVTDVDVPVEAIIADPFLDTALSPLPRPANITAPHANSRGYDLRDADARDALLGAREAFKTHQWQAAPRRARRLATKREAHDVRNPANPSDIVGQVRFALPRDVDRALKSAKPWAAAPDQRAAVLRMAADAMERATPELLALLAREAGKTAEDAIAEVREAVDFLRYYAEFADITAPPLGTIVAIAPWNFPLAIFTGQIAAALAAGNAVIAKPAEATSLIADQAVDILLNAGVPKTALQCLPGLGGVIGDALTRDPRVDGIVFTGSTATAQAIHRNMAQHLAPDTPLIAETGGINAMIVDSTALPEQAVRDVLSSAFQSAGQRCSALRVLFVQSDIAKPFMTLLRGAMAELTLGDPWDLSTDIGPAIDSRAQAGLLDYIDGRSIRFELNAPERGHFVAPTVIEVEGYADVDREVFGPVLHVATFEPEDILGIVADINDRNYSLTFGLHTRIDGRVERVTSALGVGNIYVNRNQIGAVVGVQPFGGSGLSGTGPKAGGPDYVAQFTRQTSVAIEAADTPMPIDAVQAEIDAAPPVDHTAFEIIDLPGPTGESNQYSRHPKGVVLCLGPGEAARAAQAEIAEGYGNIAVPVAVEPSALHALSGFDAVMFWGTTDEQRAMRIALADRTGPIIPLITGRDHAGLFHEQHVCVDTTASGGNAQLLAQTGEGA